MQVQLAIAKHMLDPNPCFGILPVDRFLLLAELLTSHTALDDAVLHLVFAHHAFHALSDICAVGVQLLPPVVIVYQQLGRNGVVLIRARGHSLLYQLAPGIDLCVVLVSVIFLPAFLRPTGVRVLVTPLVGLFPLILIAISLFLVPKLVAASLLYGLVLFARVTLAGDAISSESNKPWLPSFLYAFLYASIFHSNLLQTYKYLFDYQRVLFRIAIYIFGE